MMSRSHVALDCTAELSWAQRQRTTMSWSTTNGTRANGASNLDCGVSPWCPAEGLALVTQGGFRRRNSPAMVAGEIVSYDCLVLRLTVNTESRLQFLPLV